MKNKKLVLSGIFLILFSLVLTGIISGVARPIDNAINLSFSNFRNNFLTWISSLLDVVFDSYILIVASLVIAALLFISRKRKPAWVFGLTMVVSGLIIYIIKNLVARVRPLGLVEASDYSFPSGHAVTSIIFFGLLIYFIISRIKNRNFRILVNWVCVILVVLIAFSRIYLQVHWVSDIVAGVFLGLGILFAGLGIREILRIK